MDARLMAVVAEGDRGRVYLGTDCRSTIEDVAVWKAMPEWHAGSEIVPARLTGGIPAFQEYGLEQRGPTSSPPASSSP